MAISRVHTWVSGEVLTASDLNAEFNNFINNALALISPLTGSLDFNSNQALNFRFQNQSATQSAGAEGFAYWHSGEDSLHISTGTLQARVPALTGIQAGEIIGMVNASGVEGATTYGRLTLAATQFAVTSGTLFVLFPAAASSLSASSVRGLLGNSGGTTLGVSASSVLFRNSTGGSVLKDSVSSITLDGNTSGLNGRDQTAAFSANQDLHAYFITDGTTVKTVLADSAPPTGPDLTTLAAFAGYTYWAYICTLRWNGSSNFPTARVNGSRVTYEALQAVIVDGSKTAETVVGLSTMYPSIALDADLQISFGVANGVNPLNNPQLGVISGSKFWGSKVNSGVLNAHGVVALVTVPNISQQVYYSFANAPTGGQGMYLDVMGYRVPNGDAG